jgi:hypothetical protein
MLSHKINVLLGVFLDFADLYSFLRAGRGTFGQLRRKPYAIIAF